MKIIIFYSTCMVLFIVPLIFVYHQVYKDGVVGRGALLGISFIAATWLMDLFIYDDAPLDPSNRGVLFAIMVAVFMVWHLFRFHRRVLSKKTPPVASTPVESLDERRKTPDRRLIQN